MKTEKPHISAAKRKPAFLVLKSRQAGKCPGQAKYEGYLPNGQGGIQIFFEPCG